MSVFLVPVSSTGQLIVEIG